MKTRRQALFVLFTFVMLGFAQLACIEVLPRRTPTPTSTNRSLRPTGTARPGQPPATVTALPTPTSIPLGLRPADLRGSIVRFWHPWAGPEDAAVRSLVEDFNLHNEWGITIVPVAYQGLDKLGAAVDQAQAAGEGMPDLLVANLHQALGWDQHKPFTNLRPYIDDPAWGFSAEQQADFFPVFWEQDVISGQRLGLPVQRSGQLLFYNQTLAGELGFTRPPQNPDEFVIQVCTAVDAYRLHGNAESQSQGQGGWLISTNYPATLGWLYAFGGLLLKPSAPGQAESPYVFDTPETLATFQFLRGLYDAGCAWQAASDPPVNEFAGRQGLIAAGSVMDLPYQAQAFRRAGNTDEWTVLPFPSPTQKPAFDVYGPSAFIVPSAPPQQLAAWVFLKWLLEPENHALLVESDGSFPLRGAELNALNKYQADHSQWAEAVRLLPLARSEPAQRSWGEARWALQDATTQLFRSYFSADQIPATLKYLDTFVAELHLGSDLKAVFATITNTPLPTRRPTWTPTPTVTPVPRWTAKP